MEFVGAITGLTAFVITLLAIWLVRPLARRVNFVDQPGERKVHRQAIPLGGGIAIFLGISLTFLLAVILASLLKQYRPAWLPSDIYNYLPGVFARQLDLLIILIGGLVIFILGLVDDIIGLDPYLKLLGQCVVGLFLILNGIKLSLPASLPGIWGEYLGTFITLGWLVVITNSFNLLDHMDGLTAGVTVVVGAIFLIAALQTGQYFIACFLLAILGAAGAFLLFNTHPASIFMGDAGSLLLGYLMAVLTIIFTFYRESYSFYSIFVPVLVVAVPLFDTFSVIIIRLRKHQPLFQGDMNHLAHRLVDLGLGQRGAVMTIYLLTLSTGLPAVLFYLIKPESGTTAALIIFFQVMLVLIVITLLENAGRKRNLTG